MNQRRLGAIKSAFINRRHIVKIFTRYFPAPNMTDFFFDCQLDAPRICENWECHQIAIHCYVDGVGKSFSHNYEFEEPFFFVVSNVFNAIHGVTKIMNQWNRWLAAEILIEFCENLNGPLGFAIQVGIAEHSVYNLFWRLTANIYSHAPGFYSGRRDCPEPINPFILKAVKCDMRIFNGGLINDVTTISLPTQSIVAGVERVYMHLNAVVPLPYETNGV